jgi:hypothetical protein
MSITFCKALSAVQHAHHLGMWQRPVSTTTVGYGYRQNWYYQLHPGTIPVEMM